MTDKKNRTIIENQTLTGERALFMSHDIRVKNCVFEDGESPLKESKDFEVSESEFKWKYPLWYCENVKVADTTWYEMARAGVWYTNHITVENSHLIAPKNFRRCKDVTLSAVTFTNAEETLWACEDVTLDHMTAKGDYLGMNSKNIKMTDATICGDYLMMNSDHIKVKNLNLDGNYSFDGCKNVEVVDSKLMSKDAFWNSDHITAINCYIVGEYLGWNAKNLTLINCTIESLQGLCYIENLVMKNCKLVNTTLAFEYTSVDAEIDSTIDSVMNPTSGRIVADEIKTLIMEKDKIDPSKTKIIVRKGE